MKAVPRALVACLAAAVLAVGCGEPETTSGSGGTGAVDAPTGLATAQAAVAKARKGTDRPVDPTPRPAVKGKRIAIISSAQFVISSQIPTDAAKAAAEALGWTAEIYDAENKPGRYPELIRQAIGAGVDGIIVTAIDCRTAKQPLQEAKDKGIPVTPIYAFDCDDPKAGGEPTGLFTADTNFGPTAADSGKFTKQYGADQANYIIADSNNEAKVIAVNAPEFTVLNWTLEGFKEAIEASGGTEIVSTLEVTAADIGSPNLVAMIQAELLKHPEATWIKSPFTYVTTLGIAPALGARAGKLKVMGGEGFVPELDLMREDKIQAVNYISSEWVGWAATDTMNSIFLNKPPADSGIGWTMVDKASGLPSSGEIVSTVDFKAAYKKAWGVG